MALYGTPTVCNRSINRVYIIQNNEMKKKILSYQNGNKGFGEYAPIILIVTTILESFQNANERRQPYIGGGMFCMSLIYTLHSKGLATCSLNWDVPYKKEDILKNILNIKNETIIMYIAVGKYPDKLKIACSKKMNIEDIITII